MLKELSSPPYPEKEIRRWFSDGFFDLIVWIDREAVITGFQLCYDKYGNERAITWSKKRGFSHERVDDGEKSPGKNLSPVLVPDGQCPVQALIARFETESSGIDEAVRIFVSGKLVDYSARKV